MDKRVVIYGTGKLTELLCALVEQNMKIEIAGFAADDEYVNSDTYKGYPLVCFRDVQDAYPPSDFDMLALFGHKCMRDREMKFLAAKDKGYRLINYIDDTAFVSASVTIGENNVIFGQTYIGLSGKMGDNNVIRPNTYVGHDFKISNHIYIAPGCNIAGYCTIKDFCFIGIGSVITSRVTLEDETLLCAGSLLLKDTEKYSKYLGSPAKKVGEHEAEGIKVL